MKIASDTKKEEDKKADKQIVSGQEQPKPVGNPNSTTGLNKVVNDKQKEQQKVQDTKKEPDVGKSDGVAKVVDQ